jgi:hypothetical protein
MVRLAAESRARKPANHTRRPAIAIESQVFEVYVRPQAPHKPTQVCLQVSAHK